MKILLIGDASNYHHTLSTALVKMGHDVTLASDGGRWMRTSRDIDLSRGEGKVAGALLWLRMNVLLSSRLRGYDVVQISSPGFVYLRPPLLRGIFDRLRRHNGIVTLAALGTDSLYVEACAGPDAPLRYSEWKVGDTPTPYCRENEGVREKWLDVPLFDYCRYVYDNVDGILSALYEYHEVCRRFVGAGRLAYAGIPVEIPAGVPPAVPSGKVNILVACHKGREAEKGIDRLLPVVERVAARYPVANLDFVQNVPLQEFNRLLSRADIVVDQLYSYTPATTALMAMAMGKTVVSGGEQEYYDFIGEDVLRPIINADPGDLGKLEAELGHLLSHPGKLADMGESARRFVMKHNSPEAVARRCVDFWERRMR